MVLMLSLGIIAGYQIESGARGFGGPAQLSGTRNYMIESITSWTVLNVTCIGSGKLVIEEATTGKVVFSKGIHERLGTAVVIPHEGMYNFYVLNGSATCSTLYRGLYPTKRVQDVCYTMGGLSAFLLAFLLWRWWR